MVNMGSRMGGGCSCSCYSWWTRKNGWMKSYSTLWMESDDDGDGRPRLDAFQLSLFDHTYFIENTMINTENLMGMKTKQWHIRQDKNHSWLPQWKTEYIRLGVIHGCFYIILFLFFDWKGFSLIGSRRRENKCYPSDVARQGEVRWIANGRWQT